ncbi:MAG: DUF4391 domain-containing protein [Eubacteriales bacterium]
MPGFPPAAEFNQPMTKQKFYEKLDISPSLKRSFVEQIKRIE